MRISDWSSDVCSSDLLATIADVTPQTAPPINDALDQFLTGLRIAWRDGEIRPTAGAASKPKRERRRPDPLLSVTGELHEWFLAEPWRTGREQIAKTGRAHGRERVCKYVKVYEVAEEL